jgi:pyruvate/2-oxoglutarate dehydrogenase complex dihydrolipoamide acyltransferase (E2) component
LRTDIIVPKWGMTMEDAVLSAWLKNIGDYVQQDEPVAEMETDKATGEIMSPASGTLIEVVVQVGGQIAPGQVIARLGEDD